MDSSAGKDTSKEGCRRDPISLRFSAQADGCDATYCSLQKDSLHSEDRWLEDK